MTTTKLTLTMIESNCPYRYCDHVTYHQNDEQAMTYAKKAIAEGTDEMVNGKLKRVQYRNELTIEHFER